MKHAWRHLRDHLFCQSGNHVLHLLRKHVHHQLPGWAGHFAGILTAYLVLFSGAPYVTSGESPEAEKLKPTLKVNLQEVLRIGDGAQFIRIEEVCVDRQGNIYVSDSYQYAVKKFSSAGKLLKEFGKRGGGDNEFQGFPYKIIRTHDTLGIVERGLSRIRMYLPDFTFVKSFSAPGGIVDAVMDMRGRALVNIIPVSGMRDDLLLLLDNSGAILSRIYLSDTRSEPVLNMVHLGVDSKNDFVVAHRFLNNVTLYSDGGNVMWSFTIPGLPAQSTMEKSTNPIVPAMPEADLIADLAVDTRTDRYFLLGGKYSPHPNRDVYVYDNRGVWLSTFILPEKSGILTIDEMGYLYTRESERTIVKKYRIAYVYSKK